MQPRTARCCPRWANNGMGSIQRKVERVIVGVRLVVVVVVMASWDGVESGTRLPFEVSGSEPSPHACIRRRSRVSGFDGSANRLFFFLPPRGGTTALWRIKRCDHHGELPRGAVRLTAMESRSVRPAHRLERARPVRGPGCPPGASPGARRRPASAVVQPTALDGSGLWGSHPGSVGVRQW